MTPENDTPENEGQDGPEFKPGEERHLPHEAWHEITSKRPRRPRRMEGEEVADDEQEG